MMRLHALSYIFSSQTRFISLAFLGINARLVQNLFSKSHNNQEIVHVFCVNSLHILYCYICSFVGMRL